MKCGCPDGYRHEGTIDWAALWAAYEKHYPITTSSLDREAQRRKQRLIMDLVEKALAVQRPEPEKNFSEEWR